MPASPKLAKGETPANVRARWPLVTHSVTDTVQCSAAVTDQGMADNEEALVVPLVKVLGIPQDGDHCLLFEASSASRAPPRACFAPGLPPDSYCQLGAF